ncbi:MAG: hypothetical protein AAF846_26605 [Chloroflexota bacterium]
MSSFWSILFAICIALLLTACEDNTTSDASSNNLDDVTVNTGTNGENLSNDTGDLSLQEGEYYVIQATGAINYLIASDVWGGQWISRRLVDAGDRWWLRLGGSNAIDEPAISVIDMELFKEIQPGTHDLGEWNLLTAPDADNPILIRNAHIRYPNYEILNMSEDFDGTITIDTISSEGMSGSITITLHGEGGDVQVNAVFDVPVVDPFVPEE